MITYLLEILIFQLAFLLVYDLFLKGETFFQWNRAYLLVTFIISLVLPWVKIEALKTTVSSDLIAYPQAFFQIDAVTVGPAVEEVSFWSQWSWYEWVFYFGIALTTILFVVKLYRIQVLRLKGQKQYYPRFTKVVVTKSSVAFSFFKHVFLGDGIPKEKEPNILAHELVHIKQWHSLDLLFFELMRIVFWFNPLIYIYQNRTAELHEYIADAHVAKFNKKEQYQHLLAEVFQTQHISFVNQFFKSSLIKKRIVMLSKTKSKKVVQLKYLLLLPMVLSMLFYTSCEVEEKKEIIEQTSLKANFNSEIPFAKVDKVPVFPGCENALDKRACFQESVQKHIRKNFNYPKEAQDQGIQGRVNVVFTVLEDGSIAEIRKRGPHELLEAEVERIINRLPKMQPGKDDGKVVKVPFSIPITFKLSDDDKIGVEIKTFGERDGDWVPFGGIDEAPIFPGCENTEDERTCFVESVKRHIRKHFNYPQEAQDLEIQGRVAIMFTINQSGNITNIIKRGPHELLENEAERIISRLPQIQPGKHDGRVVETVYSIPITFKLK